MANTEADILTGDVVASFEDAHDERLKVVLQALVRHTHAFVKEVRPSEDEWAAAIRFLTDTGQICDRSRQEFILLSDVLGVSMLVDTLNNSGAAATPSTVLGPFYVDEPPVLSPGEDISREQPGVPLYVDVVVADTGGRPVANAVVDVWQSDSDGFYDVQRSDLAEPTLRGRFHSDAQGRVAFWSILPSPYPIPHDGPVGKLLQASGRHPWRPAHLHFMIAAPGLRRLVTHLFVADDQYLDSDAVFGVKPELIHAFAAAPADRIRPEGGPRGEVWRLLEFSFALGPDRN